MKKQLFDKYVEQGFNHIPVYKEILCDLDTPLTLFMKLANQPYTYLFESVQGGEQWARYSMVGLQSNKRIEILGNTISQIKNNKVINKFESKDPLGFIDEVILKYKTPKNIDGLPSFLGGLVGFFAYDVVKLIEPSLKQNTQIDELKIPDVILMQSEQVVVLDNLSGKAYLIIMTKPTDEDYSNSLKEIDSLLVKLNKTIQSTNLDISTQKSNAEKINHSIEKEEFLKSVQKVKQYIVDGDAFQVVLSQRMSMSFEKNPLDLYRVLRTLNPSPYMYYLNFGDFQIVGASPEILVRYEDGKAQVRPIAGTRKRGQTKAEDLALEKELLADPKELAEHLMLIDLGRNDLGRVAKSGQVKVDEQMIIERYSHVMHIVSNVVANISEDKTVMDVFKAVFPAGTLSGAPKVRAMEIINELEPVKRSIYGGAIGYLSWNGNMDTAITIRTAIIKDKQIHIQAGAGLVYDSVAETEWQETLDKATSMLQACEMTK